MAKTTITRQVLGFNTFKTLELTANGGEGFSVKWDGHDERCVLLLTNGGGSTATVTVKAGNGIQGVNDLPTYTVGAGATVAVAIESGAYKNVAGADKGNVVIEATSKDLKVALVEIH